MKAFKKQDWLTFIVGLSLLQLPFLALAEEPTEARPATDAVSEEAEYEGLPLISGEGAGAPQQGFFERAEPRMEVMGGGAFSVGSHTEGADGGGDLAGRFRWQHYRVQADGEGSAGTILRDRLQLTGELGGVKVGDEGGLHAAGDGEFLWSRYHTTSAAGLGFIAGGTLEADGRAAYNDLIGSRIEGGGTGEIGLHYASQEFRALAAAGVGGRAGIDQYGPVLDLEAAARVYLETEDLDLNLQVNRTLFGINTRTGARAEVVARVHKNVGVGVGLEHQVIERGSEEPVHATAGSAMAVFEF